MEIKEFDKIDSIIKDKKKAIAVLEKDERVIDKRIADAKKEDKQIRNEIADLNSEKASLNTEVVGIKAQAKAIISKAMVKDKEADVRLVEVGKQLKQVEKNQQEVINSNQKVLDGNFRIKEDRGKLIEDIKIHERNVVDNEGIEKELINRRVVLIGKIDEASEHMKVLNKNRLEVSDLKDKNNAINKALEIKLKETTSEKRKAESIKNSLVTKERDADKLLSDLNKRKDKIVEGEREVLRKQNSHQNNVEAFEKYVSMVKAKSIKLDRLIKKEEE